MMSPMRISPAEWLKFHPETLVAGAVCLTSAASASSGSVKLIVPFFATMMKLPLSVNSIDLKPFPSSLVTSYFAAYSS